MAKSKDMYDMQRFSDPCDDTRTETQIIWEEGIDKKGSFRYIWESNFGRMDFFKFGKKAASFFMLMLFWTSLHFIVPDITVRKILQTMAVTVINAVSIWYYRQTVDKRFTPLNILYIILCIPFSLLLYKYMDFIFYYFGYNIFMSLYFYLYYMNKAAAFVVRLCVSLAVLYVMRHSLREGMADKINVITAFISVALGVVYGIIGSESVLLYHICIISAMLTTTAAILIYPKTKEPFVRNIILIFSFVSLMEVMGRYAETIGIMADYIENGIPM